MEPHIRCLSGVFKYMRITIKEKAYAKRYRYELLNIKAIKRADAVRLVESGLLRVYIFRA